MKNLLITLTFTFFGLFASAQKKCIVINSKAIAVAIIPGMVMVDSNGNEVKQQITYNRKIYLITNCKTTPILKSILYNNINTKTTIKLLDVKNKNLGNKINAGEIVLKAKAQQFIWEIVIDLGENVIQPNQIKSIIVNGNIDKNSFKINLKESEIQTIMPV